MFSEQTHKGIRAYYLSACISANTNSKGLTHKSAEKSTKNAEETVAFLRLFWYNLFMNNKLIQQNYTTFGKVYQLKICSETDILIPSDDSVRLLDAVLEELDYTSLYRAYSPRGRKPKTSPVTMFKILVYGIMDRKYSGRELERACRRDVNYMWLLGDEPAPSHDALTRFRSGQLAEVIEDLFYQLVRKLQEIGEIALVHLFVDGTKIEANANKYTFVWKKSTSKYQARLETKICEFIKEINRLYNADFTEESLLSDMYAFLKSRQTESFVHGRGKRKSQLQKDIERVEEYMERSAKYEKYNKTFAGRNSFSKTDPDATFMHMKDDHMRNAQLKPGYNVQLGIEGEYIVGVDISSERSDQLTLIPLLERMAQNIGRHEDVTCDAGYESEENYTYFDGKNQTCYIKPQNYERSKTRKFKNDMNLRENMPYDEEKDEYTCQNGKKIKAVYTGIRKSKSGFESEITYYECESCEGCLYKKTCTRAKGNRKMSVSKKFIEQRRQSLKRITTPLGILLRTNRSIQSEGAFGVLKEDYGFRQFLHRGNKKVRAEILLMAIGYNVNKLHRKIQDNRTGSLLFEKYSA
jgi:transposase